MADNSSSGGCFGGGGGGGGSRLPPALEGAAMAQPARLDPEVRLLWIVPKKH